MRRLFAPLTLSWGLVASGCQEATPTDPAAASSAVDADGDGFWEFEDCDDTNAAVNAGAPEVCDGVDNNCDGRVDDADPEVDRSTGERWPADADGDGFGSATQTLAGCAQPEGTTDNTEDCDDEAATVYPDAPETCGDGIDQDCSGGDLRCAPTGVLTVTAAPLQLAGPTASAFGGQLASGDLDGDGIGDLLVGAPDTASGAAARAGAVGLFLGPLSGALTAPEEADAWILGSEAEARLGQSLAHTDGLLALGAPAGGAENAGIVYVADLEGGLPTSVAGVPAFLGTAGSGTGHSLAFGDLSGDGATDLIIGALGDSRGGFGAGGVWVVSAVSGSEGGALASTAAASLLGAAGDSAAWAMDTDDLNGDGIADLVVGTPGRGTEGGLFVVDGPLTATATLDDAGRFISGAYAGFRCGEAVVADGDLTGDGLADLVVGDPAHEGTDGAAWLLPGPVAAGIDLEDQAQATFGGRTDDRLGAALAAVGDVDDDGWTELAVSGTKTDQAWLFYGPVTGAQGPSTAGARLTGSPGERLGSAIAGLGDQDADGYDDVVWSDPSAARVFGYFGGRR